MSKVDVNIYREAFPTFFDELREYIKHTKSDGGGKAHDWQTLLDIIYEWEKEINSILEVLDE